MIFPNLVSALHDGLLTMDDSWDSTKLHVSDLSITIPGEGCPKQVWLRTRGAPRREPGMGTLIMFDHGHRIHERVVDILRRGLTGWEIVGVEEDLSHTPVLARYDIAGRADMLIANADSLIVVDFKTVRGRAFSYLKEPRPGNSLQVQTYATAAGANAGALLYLDREGQNTPLQFEIERNDHRVEASCKLAREMIDGPEPDVLRPVYQIEKRKTVESVYRKSPWNCEHCSYLDVSCDGALPAGKRTRTLIGHVKEVAPGITGFVPNENADDGDVLPATVYVAGDDARRDQAEAA